MISKLGGAAALAFAATALTFTSPAAHADTRYDQAWTRVDSTGSSIHLRSSYVNDQDVVGFRDSYFRSGPEGVSTHHTFSEAR
ncbi:hypothetical protein [Spirillospora sp. NPDC047279]|uniref:hypothetical protein n=1 Tax=Spirillospora sp. NPDC047279 TaxID=3155478 RepID=UPI0033D935D6